MNVLSLLSTFGADIEFGEVIRFERMGLVPIYFESHSSMFYLTFEDMDVQDMIGIEEVSAAGSIPEMVITNESNRPLFIPDGTTLQGNKQDRSVNLSAMINPSSECTLPVSCVEKFRWSDFSRRGCPSSTHCDIELRKFLKIRRDGADQTAVWNHVDSLISRSGVNFPTKSYHSVREHWNEEISEYADHFRFPESACGVVVQIDGTSLALDFFDRTETMQVLWPKLSRSYAVSVMNRAQAVGCPHLRRYDDSRKWLDETLSSVREERWYEFGNGRTCLVSSQNAVGAACLWNNRLVHLSLFSTRE